MLKSGWQTLSSKISRRVPSGIVKEAVIFEQAQCIITTSYTRQSKKAEPMSCFSFFESESVTHIKIHKNVALETFKAQIIVAKKYMQLRRWSKAPPRNNQEMHISMANNEILITKYVNRLESCLIDSDLPDSFQGTPKFAEQEGGDKHWSNDSREQML